MNPLLRAQFDRLNRSNRLHVRNKITSIIKSSILVFISSHPGTLTPVDNHRINIKHMFFLLDIFDVATGILLRLLHSFDRIILVYV